MRPAGLIAVLLLTPCLCAAGPLEVRLRQQSPVPGGPHAYTTTVSVRIEPDRLVFLFDCADPDPSRIAVHTMSRDGDLEGDDSVTIVLDPYGDRRTGYYFQVNAAAGRAYQAQFGGDVTWRITPQLAAVFTANTDFAETEVDSRQLNVTRFPLFFPEKRSFFLEGSNRFEFGLGLGSTFIPFFSRRIGLFDGQQVPIDGGVKLNGRIGHQPPRRPRLLRPHPATARRRPLHQRLARRRGPQRPDRLRRRLAHVPLPRRQKPSHRRLDRLHPPRWQRRQPLRLGLQDRLSQRPLGLLQPDPPVRRRAQVDPPVPPSQLLHPRRQPPRLQRKLAVSVLPRRHRRRFRATRCASSGRLGTSTCACRSRSPRAW